MQVQVARWDNSLGLRIPKDIALRTGLREGTRVDVEAEGDRIIISPAGPRYVLADLLKGMTPQAMREAFDWGLARPISYAGAAVPGEILHEVRMKLAALMGL
jgi:antitoxin MazE